MILANVIVFLADLGPQGGWLSIMGGYGRLMEAGWIYGPSVADGEWYRLVTSMFLHFGLLHIAFNMYALYLFGPLLEQLYGHIDYLIIYFLCGIGGSVMTILFAPDVRGGRRIRRDLRPLRPGVHGLAAAAPAARSAGARHAVAGWRPAAWSTWSSPSPSRASAGPGTSAACWSAA